MKRHFSLKSLAIAGVAIGALAAASAANARSDVFLSIGVPIYGGYGGYVQPAPVYVQPRPVYVEPRPVYFEPRPVYVQPQVVYEQPRHDRGYDNSYDYEREARHRHWRRSHRYGPYGDLDGDGVPNRYDRFPDNPYRY